MRVWPTVLLISFGAADALACPTCVGPRLGDATGDGLSVSGQLRTSLGSDHVSGLTRWELRNELTAGFAYGKGAFDVAVPLLWRTSTDIEVFGVGDLSLRGGFELWRREAPEASDGLRLSAALFLPTAAKVRDWRLALGTQAVTPSLALGYRHSDQGWAITATLWGAAPVALADSAFAWGPSLGGGVAVEYAPVRWLTLRPALDAKQQWAAREATFDLLDSQYFALFLSGEVRAQPVRWFGVAASIALPLLCVSPGDYAHGPVYRLALDVAI